jgi:hypothetical protein
MKRVLGLLQSGAAILIVAFLFGLCCAGAWVATNSAGDDGSVPSTATPAIGGF